jgi:predicted anti-sigma-YlaC factor YlaD
VDCHEVEGLLDAYQDRELEPAVSVSVRDHVDGCVACRGRLANADAVGRMIRRAPYYQAPEALRDVAAARLGSRCGPGRVRDRLDRLRQVIDAGGAGG